LASSGESPWPRSAPLPTTYCLFPMTRRLGSFRTGVSRASRPRGLRLHTGQVRPCRSQLLVATRVARMGSSRTFPRPVRLDSFRQLPHWALGSFRSSTVAASQPPVPWHPAPLASLLESRKTHSWVRFVAAVGPAAWLRAGSRYRCPCGDSARRTPPPLRSGGNLRALRVAAPTGGSFGIRQASPVRRASGIPLRSTPRRPRRSPPTSNLQPSPSNPSPPHSHPRPSVFIPACLFSSVPYLPIP
jgi:hypothetical protein